MDTQAITSGTVMLIDSRDGNVLTNVVYVPITHLTIASINAAGAYTIGTVSNETNKIVGYLVAGNIVTISGCTHTDSIKNNGNYKIKSPGGISGQDITLVSMYDNMPIITGTDKTGCKISKISK